MRRFTRGIGIGLLGLMLCTGQSVPVHEAVAAQPFFRGVDISTLPAIEDAHGAYFEDGVQRDLLVILKRQGVNYVRLRNWNNPTVDAQGYNDLAHTVALAKRVKQAGMHLLVDFHYSDFWADPGQQNKPKAWASFNDVQLANAVHAYTKQVLVTLRKQGAMPDAVQIGNEISSGMLWPNGKTWGAGSGGFDVLASLLKAGVRGVRDAETTRGQVKVMLHVDTGGDNDRSRYFFDALKQRQVPYDWIGLSFYPYWHGAMADLKANMADLAARYNKPVIVAEMAYGFTTDYAGNTKNIFDDAQAERAGYPATEQGQAAVVRDIIAAVQRVPNQKGLGVFYWEPGWIMTDEGTNNYVTANNGWKNQALFDYAGNMLSGMRVLGHYVVPEQLLAQAKQQLAIGFAKGDRASSVTTNLRLPAKAANGATVTWRSSNPTVVSAAGRVTRPAKGRKSVLVSLTAVLKLGKSVDVKTFGILVKAR